MELHANLPAALWPADNCGAVLREHSQRFSPGLQLKGLHITIHNRLNTGPTHLELLCMCCIACWFHGKHSEKRWLSIAKWALWNWCYLKHFNITTTREHTDKRNSNGPRGQGEQCLLDMWLFEYVTLQHITLQRLKAGYQWVNAYCWLFGRGCYLNWPLFLNKCKIWQVLCILIKRDAAFTIKSSLFHI